MKQEITERLKSYYVCITEHAKLIPTVAIKSVTCIERERKWESEGAKTFFLFF